MSAVRYLAASNLRRRWKRVVGLVLLVGLVGAIAMSVVAGARRSSTALGRFSAATRSSDVTLIDGGTSLAPPRQIAAVARVAGVEGVGVARGMLIAFPQESNLTPIVMVRYVGGPVDLGRLVSGRQADPAAPLEITIGEQLAAQLHLGVGGHLDAESFSPAQAAVGDTGSPDVGPPNGPHLRFQVVGIVRRPLDLGDKAASGGALILTPAFDRAFRNTVGSFGTLLRVRTAHPASDVPRVIAAGRRIFRHAAFFDAESVAAETQGAANAIGVETAALLVVAAIVAGAGSVTVGLVLSREIDGATADQPTLRAMGLTRGQRLVLAAPDAPVVALAGAAVALAGAGALSAVFPLGIARRAEPSPGIHLDWAVLSIGAAAVVVLVGAVAVVSALHATRSPAGVDRGASTRTTARLAATGQRMRLPVAAAAGLRMALGAGRDDDAVPTRSAVAGVVLGVVGLVAVAIFSSSLTHAVGSPRASGWNWDTTRSDQAATACDSAGRGLTGRPEISDLAAACVVNIQIGGRPVSAWFLSQLTGSIEPTIVTGRAPLAADEVALGSVTLAAAHVRVGDVVSSVRLGVPGDRRTTYRVVGQAVLPLISDTQPLADGAVFTSDALPAGSSTVQAQRYFLIRFAAGVDAASANRRLARIDPSLGPAQGHPVAVEIDRLGQIGWAPGIVAGLLSALALVAIGHALVTSVRRRRRELGVLKALGFDQRQLRASIAWQATVLAAVGAVLGAPLGILVGRLVWRSVAHNVGTVVSPVVPVLLTLAVIPAVLVVVNFLAYLPGRAAARTPAAIALRSE